MPQAPQLIASLTSPVHNTTHTYYGDRDILQTTLNIWKNKPDNGMISRYTYNVNNLGQRTAVTTAGEAFDTASPADWQWSYDVLGQVKSANRDTAVARNTAENYQYAYDQIGNRISSQKGTAPELTYTSNSLNQYTAIGSSLTPSYDADGNQLSGLMPTVALPERGQLTFGYNAHNRLIAVSKNNIILENYTHDHEGRRIQEGSTITIYDGYNAIAEYTVNGVLKTTYAWGLDLSNTLQGAGGVGGLLSVTDYTTQTPLVSYPTYDGNGNVTEYVTEANNGTISAHYEYDAFGNVINTNNPNNTPTGKQYRYQFSTKPYNRLTGLSYYNYRDYDPVAGRWIGRDPIGEDGGINIYCFVYNKSLTYKDVLGLAPYKNCKCVGIDELQHGDVVGTFFGGRIETRVITKRRCKFRCYHGIEEDECHKIPCYNPLCKQDHGVEVMVFTLSKNKKIPAPTCASVAGAVQAKTLTSGQTKM